MNYDEAMKHCIFRYLSGSHAYGTNTNDSDFDYRGVFIAPLRYSFELFNTSFVGNGTIGQHLKNAVTSIELGEYDGASERIRQALQPDNGDLNLSVQTVNKPGNDEELQELRKFLKLAADCNPNIVEFLFIEKGIRHTTPTWEKIKANRSMFLSKKARFTFSGYAIAQLKKIETHRGYLLNPKGKPSRKDFDLPEKSIIPSEHRNIINSLPLEYVSDSAKDVVKREKQYQTVLNEYQAYERWKRERNEKRKALEAKCGYDSKHAMHLIRLSRMAKEIISTGQVIVHRPDAKELLNIRMGNVPYEKIIEEASKLDSELDAMYKNSPLRERPDHKGISELYKEICREHYKIDI